PRPGSRFWSWRDVRDAAVAISRARSKRGARRGGGAWRRLNERIHRDARRRRLGWMSAGSAMLDACRMPWRFQRGARGRLVLTVTALACGVALVCAIDLVNRAVLRAFTEVIDTMAGRAALQVSAGGSGLFPEEMAEKVASVAGVELAVPLV